MVSTPHSGDAGQRVEVLKWAGLHPKPRRRGYGYVKGLAVRRHRIVIRN